ncbi:MAG TPA: response regulator transcription factor [Anaerolineae bacterium]|nr:response regulator transcription factor [Anaerolineae bacterium]
MGSTVAPITVIIADDHEVTRLGLRTLLQAAPDIELVGEATDGNEAQQLISQLQPHVAVLDLVMPGTSPAEIVLWAYDHYPETAVLILTAHDRDYCLAQMLEVGAVGYLDKNERGEALLDAIRRAACGQVLFTQEQCRRARDWRENVQAVWEALTAREREVLELLCRGHSNQEIAEHLHIVEKTVEKHVGAILDQLGVASRTEAILWVLNAGLDKACGMVGETPDKE